MERRDKCKFYNTFCAGVVIGAGRRNAINSYGFSHGGGTGLPHAQKSAPIQCDRNCANGLRTVVNKTGQSADAVRAAPSSTAVSCGEQERHPSPGSVPYFSRQSPRGRTPGPPGCRCVAAGPPFRSVAPAGGAP